YDEPGGLLRGLGGFVEGVGSDAFAVDNAGLLSTPGYVLLNADLHYDPPAGSALVSRVRLYVDVQNLLGQRYIASSTNITDSLNPVTGVQNGAGVLAAATGSIYAGAPRSVFGGVRVRF
ncbi:MAG: TonB-dependent receptor, partial [Caulobacteraceae bacterium]|nr:TonB-dependent receptor [Caulobacter sp.]